MQAKCREYGQVHNANATALQAQRVNALVTAHAPTQREQHCGASRNAQIPDADWYHVFLNGVLEQKRDAEE